MNNLELPIIVPLDNMNNEQIHQFCNTVKGKIHFVKVGMEAFYSEGKSLVLDLHQKYGFKIFLDLKLHDIPNTVSKAIKSLEGLPIELLTLHATGGEAMLKAAVESATQHLPESKLLAVTYLTSLSKTDFTQIWGQPADQWDNSFIKLVELISNCGVHGLVCSPQELELVSQVPAAKNLLRICPGIRFQDEIDQNKTQDQKRVLSPQKAMDAGASYLVMGRSLTQASDLNARLKQLESLI